MARWFAGALLAALIVGAASSAEAQTTTLRLNSITPPNHWFARDLMAGWARDVEEATGGRVRIEATGAPLGPMARTIDMVAQGVADVSAGNHGPIAGRFRVTQILDIPFISTSAEAGSVAFWRTHQEFLDRANEHRGVHVLSLWSSSPAHLFAVREPLARPEDLQGRRVVVVSATAGRIAETFRAVTLNAATDRWYEMLSRGVADAVISTNTAITGWNLQNVLKAQLLFPEGLHYTSFFLVINRDRWMALRPEDRAAIERLSGEAFAIRAGRMFDHHDRVAREAIAGGGVRITTAPPEMIERMRAEFRPVEEEWLRNAAAAGVDGPAALARFRELVRAAPR